jgi:hypothetical protein
MVKKKKQPKNKRDRLWIEAKRRCRLNENDIQIAKEKGIKSTKPHQEYSLQDRAVEAARQRLDSPDVSETTREI